MQGSSFDEVCKLCLLYEGSIIRATRRLDELMRQMEVHFTAQCIHVFAHGFSLHMGFSGLGGHLDSACSAYRLRAK